MAITLPYRFDTSRVWHTILKGACALNAVLVFGVLLKLATGQWLAAIGIVVAGAVVLGFTRLLVRHSSGSVGILYRDRAEIEPNTIFGIKLPGPVGTYAMHRFSAVRVEFVVGPIIVDAPSPGRSELVWLAGRPGTPDVLLARASDGGGLVLGAEFGEQLGLPVEEKNAPKVVTP
jgi:hypothetical protein